MLLSDNLFFYQYLYIILVKMQFLLFVLSLTLIFLHLTQVWILLTYLYLVKTAAEIHSQDVRRQHQPWG